MPDPFASPLGSAVKYNPHLWGDNELRGIFVARTRELDGIVARIRALPAGSVPQHLLVIGHRGMGKTTLLRRIALAVADDPELHRDWIALGFPEEQYTVSTLAELWSNVLDALADTLEREGATADELNRLDSRIQSIQGLPTREREDAALALIEKWVAEHGRRLLLLIDSSDLLFSGLSKGETGDKNTSGGATPLWRLRKTLSHRSELFWLGASYQALESEHPYADAFHDFFELLELRPLSLEEMRQAMLALARTFGVGRELRGEAAEAQMQKILQTRPERLKTLRAITGGNPRTTVILYELFAAGWEGDVHSDLKALLDIMTPLYKARMEHLAEQPRKLLAHLLEHWAPIPVRELSRVSGIPNTTVSSQLTRLEAEGLVEKARLAGTRRSGYQASERFFNIWYLMRTSPRRVRQRLTWLVEFMRLWFSADELQALARRHQGRLDDLRRPPAERLQYALALSDALPEGCPERHQLEWSVFTAARRLAEDVRRPLVDAVPELFDGEGQEAFVTADDYLRRFEALDEGLVKCPHVEGEEARREWVDAVKGSLSLSLGEKEGIAADAAGLSREQYEGLMEWFRDEQRKWSVVFDEESVATVKERARAGDFFPDCPDSELAYWQIMGRFSDRIEALRFALGLMERFHQDRWTEKLYRKVLEFEPNNSRIWTGLGNLLKNHLGRYEEAEAAYQQAIDIDPNDAWLWYSLGDLLQSPLGRYEEAEIAYRRAIEIDPKFIGPWNDLGTLLQDRLDRIEEAEAVYRHAIDFAPEDPYPPANLARLLARRGEEEQVSSLYRQVAAQSAKLADPPPGIAYVELLLQAHLWLGNRDHAFQALTRLTDAADQGDTLAMFKLREQVRECHAIGLAPALADLMESSPLADFLRPLALALRAAAGQADALDGIAPEMRTMAEEVLRELKSGKENP